MPLNQIPWNKGVKISEETRQKIKAVLKGRIPWNKGKKGCQKPYWLGKKRSPEMVARMRLNRIGKRKGEDHPFWIKDRTKLVKKDKRNDMAYKEWRKNVYTRDNFKCRIADNNCKGRVEAHHILGWKAHPELRYVINNGITLCHFHHPFKKEDENKLSPYFKKLVTETK